MEIKNSNNKRSWRNGYDLLRFVGMGAIALVAPSVYAIEVESIHPPHWWVGMHDTSLQLQIHGKDIR